MKLLKGHGIYIILILGLSLIRISPYSCGNANLDGIFNELAVGGVASTLVAWLIFANEAKKLKKKNESLKMVIIHPFARAILNYMQQFCCACTFMPPEERSRKAIFSRWNEEYCNRCELCGEDKDFLEMDLEYILSSQQHIVEMGENILNQKIWLSKENIMGKEDFDAIHKIISNFVLNKTLLNNASGTHNLKVMNDNLNQTLQNTKLFKGFTECPYSSDIRISTFLISEDIAEY